MKYVFLIFSPYCMAQGSIEVTHNEFVYQLKRKYLGDGVTYVERYDVWSFSDGIGWHLLALAVHGVVFYSINIVIETINCSKTEYVHVR